MDDLMARVLLSSYATSADEKVGSLIAQYGASEALARLKAGEGSKALSQKINQTNLQKDFDQVQSETKRANAMIITPENDYWPNALADLDFATPYCLWVKGDPSVLMEDGVAKAIVGARAATNYGERIAAELGSILGEWGIVTVSGAAFGIDAAAHRGAMAAGGETVAVLACGIDIAYPSAHEGLLSRISQSGCVISEAPPGTPPLKHQFLTRNRIIAALSTEVVVVEAALRSGSLSTANWANAIGRKVWGVPGPITSATSAGVHQGIRDKSMEILLEAQDLVSQTLV